MRLYLPGNDIGMGDHDNGGDAYCLAAVGKVGVFKFSARCKSEGGHTVSSDFGGFTF